MVCPAEDPRRHGDRDVVAARGCDGKQHRTLGVHVAIPIASAANRQGWRPRLGSLYTASEESGISTVDCEWRACDSRVQRTAGVGGRLG